MTKGTGLRLPGRLPPQSRDARRPAVSARAAQARAAFAPAGQPVISNQTVRSLSPPVIPHRRATLATMSSP